MSPNRRVVLFVVISTFLLFVVSTVSILTGFTWEPLARVNLVADVISQPTLVASSTDADSNTVVTVVNTQKDLSLYHKANTITQFNPDSNTATLQRFLAKLQELRRTKKGRIRIAYFGDSMIEGDLLTQTLRQLLQKEFGGSGVGFVPVNSPVSKFRQTVTADCSDSWTDDNFKGKNTRLYLSGHSYTTGSGWITMTDRTVNDSNAQLEKSLLCGQQTTPVSIRVNDAPFSLQAPAPLNRIVLQRGNGQSIKVAMSNPALPVYGLSFETADGIFVDNFSFRGITGVEFGKVDSAFLSAIAAGNPYDLVVVQYGVNLLFKPNEKNFSWYAKMMQPVVRKLRNCFTNSDFIIVSTADRAFRYADGYRSAVGIDSLIKVQAQLAWNTNSAFYNQFATMGGTNSIVDWARQKPALANQDYVHPNHRGAAILGELFYKALMKEYHKYELTHP